MIKEGKIKINITLPTTDVSTDMDVFYNPKMVSNRNISLLLLSSLNKLSKDKRINKNKLLNKDSYKNLKIALPLAGSAIRGLRFLTELKPNLIENLYLNDKRQNFVTDIKSTLKLNKIKPNLASKLILSQDDANLFLTASNHFDYIDIDPFGSPNPFLAAAISKLKRGAILAITATDTAALTGTYTKVCRRKYWAEPMHNYLMHEIGLRILIRKIQLQGIQFNKALTPILSYHKNHYYRIFFISNNGKKLSDNILNNHKYFLYNKKDMSWTCSKYNLPAKENSKKTKEKNSKENSKEKTNVVFAGPLWTENLHDLKLIKSMLKLSTAKAKLNPKFKEDQKFLTAILDEAKFENKYPGGIAFYDLHEISKHFKINCPKQTLIFKKLKGYKTQFSPTGIKTNLNIRQILKKIK